MPWLLPAPTLLVVVLIVLALVPTLARRPSSGFRLFAEAFVVTLAATAVVQACWWARGWIDQRW